MIGGVKRFSGSALVMLLVVLVVFTADPDGTISRRFSRLAYGIQAELQ